jgi:hypothetical protein
MDNLCPEGGLGPTNKTQLAGNRLRLVNRQARDLQEITAIWPKPLQPFPSIKESTDSGCGGMTGG